MKAGGVLFAETPEAAAAAADALIGRDLMGYRVEEVLVEERLPVEAEFFVAITYDELAKAPAIVASAAGGIEVEQVLGPQSAQLVHESVDMTWPFSEYRGRGVAISMGLKGREMRWMGDVVRRLYELFMAYDATLAEINPLVPHAEKGFIALDAHIDLEDEAMSRHPDLESSWGIVHRPSQTRPPTPFEEGAARIDASDHRGVAGRMVEFDGDLGLLIGGGGASLTVFDAILAHGGRPANYCEIGGNPSVRKIRDLTQLILRKAGVRKLAVIMNVVSNTRVDLVARGVIKGIVELGMDPQDVLTVFRVPGAWEDEGAMILRHYGVEFHDRTVSLDQAAKLAVVGSRC
jgi:succinyl-CoA synthetase beta subunit/citryl-CoA synthetase large subunit